MTRLLRLELTRLRWRRAVVVLLVGCALVAVVIFAGTAWSTRPVSAEELRQAQVQVDRDLEQGPYQREIRRCEKDPGQYGVPRAELCRQRVGPQVDWYVSRNQLGLREAVRGPGLGVITLLMGLLMLVGTTFAGADWNSGSMSNQLLFEPRRLRVWLAKAGAVLLLALTTSALLLAGFWGAMALLARSRGIDVRPDVPELIAASSGRAVLVIAAAAVGAYAITMLVRSTVFTLGAMFAVVVGATLLLALVGVSEAWFPNKNLGAVIWNGTSYYVEPPPGCFTPSGRPAEGLDCDSMRRLGLWTGVRNLGVLLGAAVALSMWSFRRRDVP